MFSFLHVNPEVTITLDENAEMNQKLEVFAPDLKMPCFSGTDKISGKLVITPPPGKVVGHKGIVLSVFGEYRGENNQVLSRFFSRNQSLMPPGDLATEYTHEFSFDSMNMPTSTYFGTTVNVVYGVELRIIHRISDFVVEKQFIVLNFAEPKPSEPIHNEVGIRNILHVEFIFPKANYDVGECVVGAAYFILVRLRIVFMGISLYRNETYESDSTFLKKRTLLKNYDVLDGAPVRGDHIPIRVFMGESNIWPYQQYSGSPLAVEHYLRIEMVDENNKKYFKRMKLNFDRYEPKVVKSVNELDDDFKD
ncbi:Vacuolar protein sorting-associated protein 26 [Tritrichomonas foetus]|uniref:Vacuolar protein sorting-associated protein 26 n=1 Tax=Tritrichomonas foetus TaxID=1144522 RepID=A0A1J4L3C1_9EUKA|nr:Vacuolar protein sorting-associated protein 26 [Tritrichomonas foetus]|eukprot:OHT17576.1 Vacuolar protein sorting-associated protein 26 [Tritrichomonas foetus]